MSPRSRTLRITFDIKVRVFTIAEMEEMGLEREDRVPLGELDATEIAEVMSDFMLTEEAQDEAFAGSDVLARLVAIEVVSAA